MILICKNANTMINWNDYHLILSIHRSKGLPGAAEHLGVTLSTVFRRLERMEDNLGVRLFDRNKGVYHPTDAGQRMVQAAERMEQEALAGDRAITGQDQQLQGSITITSTESISASFLARHIPAFQKQYPGLTVTIMSSDRKLSLADREADIALRPRRPKTDSLIGRKIGQSNWGIYAAAPIAGRYKKIRILSDLAGLDVIGWEGSPAAHDTMTWLASRIDPLNIIYKSNSLLTNASLAASGDALVPLPCRVGSFWPGLAPILSPLDDAMGELWLVMHQDLKRNARVRALADFIAHAAKEEATIFCGFANSF